MPIFRSQQNNIQSTLEAIRVDIETTNAKVEQTNAKVEQTNTKLDRFNNYFISLAIAMTTMAVGAIFAASAVVIVKTLIQNS